MAINRIIDAVEFGVRADGVTDDAPVINAAICSLASVGGGTLQLPAGKMVIGSTLVARSGVILRGVGMNATVLSAKDALSAPVIQSLGFASLTGTNTWMVSGGVIHGFGLEDLQIDGNKAAQTGSPNGVEIFGKRLFIKNVIIRDCGGCGIYSEAGAMVGQADHNDLPEGNIGPLWIRSCGSHGWQMRGPHDAVISQLTVNDCGGDGLRVELSATYSGTCDIGFAHIYANQGYGVYGGAPIKARHLIVENNRKEGLYLANWHSHIGMLESYTNCHTSGSFDVVLPANARSATIGTASIRPTKGGIQVGASFAQIGSAMIDASGAASQGVGIDILPGANNNTISAVITGFSGVGGTGLKTGAGGAVNYNSVSAVISDCATLWNNASTGAYNIYNIRGQAGAPQTFFTGYGPNATDGREQWTVAGSKADGTTCLSEIRKISGAPIDLNTTAEQWISVGCAELLGLVPEPEDVTVSVYSNGANTAWALQYVKVIGTSASVIDFKIKLSVPAGVPQTGNLLVTVRL